jgi:hypothetical protein
MATPTDPFNDIADRGREVADSAVRSWADTMQSFAGTPTTGEASLPALRGIVEQYFDLAEQALATQRTLARQWLSGTITASGEVAEQTRRATRSVAEHTANATETVVDNATETAQVAADETATIARAATATAD